MLNRVLQAVWPWSRKAEITGPIVAVLELDGVLMKPRSRQRSLPNDNIHFDKVKTAADKAFAVKGLQALALNVNCPGTDHFSLGKMLLTSTFLDTKPALSIPRLLQITACHGTYVTALHIIKRFMFSKDMIDPYTPFLSVSPALCIRSVDHTMCSQRNAAKYTMYNVIYPGGSPAQCELIAGYLRSRAAETNVPILAFANDVAASGGYWLMCAADELYACNTSLVGSIGVVGKSFGVVDAMKRLGVERRLAHAGDKKVSSDPFSEETEDQKALKKEVMESLHKSFIDFVKGRRAATLLDPVKHDVFSGKVWTGRDAAAIGVVDQVGTLREVLRDKYGEKVHVMQFGKPAVPWWAQMRNGVSFPGDSWNGTMLSPGVVHSAVDGLVDAVHVRSMWAKYGL